MKIVDLTKEHEEDYFLCLEDWSSEISEAGSHKAEWYEKMRDRVRVKLALDDEGVVGGMIQYMPIEDSFADGADLYIVYCIWVHGYKEGRGNFQKRGMGKALVRAAEEDARERGARGIAAWGLALPFFMRASWFKKQGFKSVDRDGISLLLWKPFTDGAVPPRFIKRRKKPERVAGKVSVTAFINGWCPAQNMVYERARRAAEKFGDKVEFTGIDTSERENFLEWGISDGLFVDGKEVRTGPPPSYEKIERIIGKRVKRLR
jgi:GNAT superfamily N-acetyltransferase